MNIVLSGMYYQDSHVSDCEYFQILWLGVNITKTKLRGYEGKMQQKKQPRQRCLRLPMRNPSFFFLKIGKSINPFVVKKKNKQIHVYLDF